MLTNFEDTKTTYNRMQISSLITRAPIPRELDSPDNTEIKSHSYRSRLKGICHEVAGRNGRSRG